MPVRYYLQLNPMTPDPNDHSARVETLGNLTPDALAQELVNRGIITNVAQARGFITGYESVIAEKVAEGWAVNTPLMTVRPGINGVFDGATDTYDNARHSLRGKLDAGPLLEAKLATATVEKILKAAPAPVLIAFINENTGGENATITPGGIGRIVGEELKFDPAKPNDGIYFVPATGAAVKVTVLSNRTEGRLIFGCPALAAGSYHVQVRRTYGTANPVLRTGELSAPLTVA